MIISLLLSVQLGLWLLIVLCGRRLRAANRPRRSAVFSALGITNTEHKRLVGFFHPYWRVPHFLVQPLLIKSGHFSNAGGGGERVLWTAIAAMQRAEPDIVSVIYTGDVDTSKQAMIDKVKVQDP
jgi:alpha-1,2-mannosyltransferase